MVGYRQGWPQYITSWPRCQFENGFVVLKVEEALGALFDLPSRGCQFENGSVVLKVEEALDAPFDLFSRRCQFENGLVVLKVEEVLDAPLRLFSAGGVNLKTGLLF